MRYPSARPLAVALALLTLSLCGASAQYNWTNDPNNPLITDGPRALEPSVLYDSTTGHYDLWYSDGSNVKRVVSTDGHTWNTAGASQNLTSLFSVSFCFSVEVVKIGSTYYLYSGCQSLDGNTFFIALATSPDGNTWTKHASSPVLMPGGSGTWENNYVLYPKIAVQNNLFYLYYQGNGSPAQIGLATSEDGVHWTKQNGNPIIGIQDIGQTTTAVAPSAVDVVDGTFFMIVNTADGALNASGNLATSSNGITWSFYQGNPVLTTGTPGSWNAGWLADGTLRCVQGTFMYWYCAADTKPGQGYQTWRIGLATSGGNGGTQDTFWHQTGGPLATQDVRSLASNSHGDVFAGTWTHGEVYKSTNDGDTWAVCGALPVPNPVLGLAIDSHDHIFASVWLQGIARSTDNGATWQMKNSGLTNLSVRKSLVDKQGSIWVGTEGGLFRSTNDGETWSLMRQGFFGGVYLDSTNAIMSGDGNTIVRSTDGGASWSARVVTTAIICGVHSDGSYYGWQPGSQIFRSTDYGATWSNLQAPNSSSGPVTDMLFTPQGDAYIPRNGNAAGALWSKDNGAHWELKNGGLTTSILGPIIRTNRCLFLGTGGAGVFRSSLSSAPQSVSLTLPRLLTVQGGKLEIPINVTDVSGQGIYAYEFTLVFNTPDSILALETTPVTIGTLSGSNGWSVLVNTSVPNQVSVGAYGATPLSGQGVLLKLKATTTTNATAGDSSLLTLSRFVFNAGNPVPGLHNGSVIVHERTCGDADESGTVQAYDAALTLREAIGPMNPPPPALSALGRLNADVNLNGQVDVYDAALILRHVVGLALPESTATCWGGTEGGALSDLALTSKVLGVEHEIDQTVVQVQLSNVPANFPVYSCSLELTTSAVGDDTTSLTLPALANGSMGTVNRIGNGHFKVGIVNPYGIDVEAIPLTLTAKYGASLNAITLKGIFLNDVPSKDVTLTNIVTTVAPPNQVQPLSYDLVGAYPNPFNPTTRIVFKTPAAAQVHLEIYNAQGARVKVISDTQVASGQHEAIWDGTNMLGQAVASGQYYCMMRAGSFVKTIRVMLLK